MSARVQKGKKAEKWYADILSKIVTGIIIGAVLALINQLFWYQQNKQTHAQAMLSQKIETYSSLSKAFTGLITNHNTLAIYNNIQRCDTTCQEHKRESQGKTLSLLADLSINMSKASVYFPGETQNLKDVAEALSKIDDSSTQTITPDTKIMSTIKNVLSNINRSIKDQLDG